MSKPKSTTVDKVLTYLERLQQSQEEKTSSEALLRAEEAESQLQLDRIATKRSLAKAHNELEILCGAYPFDTNKVLQKQLEIEGYENGLELIDELEEKLFPRK